MKEIKQKEENQNKILAYTNQYTTWATEGEAPMFKIPIVDQTIIAFSSSCFCADANIEGGFLNILLDPLPKVEYVVADERETFYTKKLSVTLNEEIFRLTIFVCKKEKENAHSKLI